MIFKNQRVYKMRHLLAIFFPILYKVLENKNNLRRSANLMTAPTDKKKSKRISSTIIIHPTPPPPP